MTKTLAPADCLVPDLPTISKTRRSPVFKEFIVCMEGGQPGPQSCSRHQ
jgi:hypothetical protein